MDDHSLNCCERIGRVQVILTAFRIQNAVANLASPLPTPTVNNAVEIFGLKAKQIATCVEQNRELLKHFVIHNSLSPEVRVRT